MAIEEYGVISAAVGVAIVIGFILGKLSANANKNRSSTQRVTQNQLLNWKISPDYSDILLKKNPSKYAANELNNLKPKQDKNEEEIKEIKDELVSHLSDLKTLRKEASTLVSKAEKAVKLEVSYSLWSSSYQRLRQKTEDCNNRILEQSYNMRFLKFIYDGSTIPRLNDQMDNVALGSETENPFKKNLDLIESIIGSMESENQEKVLDYFGIS